MTRFRCFQGRQKVRMNIHEYQAKAVLREFGVPVPRGHAAFSVEEAVKAARELGAPVLVVKAQIHAGGRGQAGGVKLVKWNEEVRKASRSLASISRRARPSSASSTSRRSSIAKARALPLWHRRRGAWTSRRSRARAPSKS